MQKNNKTYNLLDLRPVRIREYKLNKAQENENITILVPKFGIGRIGRWLSGRSRHPNYLIHLDEIGTFVWNLCDGEKQVKEITNLLKEKFGEKVDPVCDRVAFFLRKMERAKMIAFKETAKSPPVLTNLQC